MAITEAVSKLKGIAEAIKSAKSDEVTVMDVGDVEVIKMDGDIIATLPKGKDVYFISKGKFPISTTTVRKLSDTIAEE
jgi:hypothetical protein